MIEVLWKVIEIIIYQSLVKAIEFHEILHGFQGKRGKGMATLEAKLLHQISIIFQEVLCDIFIDIHKAYGVGQRLDLMILEGYGVGPQAI